MPASTSRSRTATAHSPSSRQTVIDDLGYDAGGWRVEKHPRFLASVRGNGRADIVGFGDAGVYVAYSNGDGTFAYQPIPVVDDFGYRGRRLARRQAPALLDRPARQPPRRHRRLRRRRRLRRALEPATGPSSRRGSCCRTSVSSSPCSRLCAALARRTTSAIWRSSDRGRTWSLVHPFPGSAGSTQLASAGQLVWAPGTANFVYAAGGTALAVSRDGGATFTNVMPTRPEARFKPVNHVAAATTLAGRSVAAGRLCAVRQPADVRLLRRRADTGSRTTARRCPTPHRRRQSVCANSPAAKVLVVSPRSPLEVFVSANQVGSATDMPAIFRGDYLQFLGTHSSDWEPVPLPNLGMQFSGNVFMEAHSSGTGRRALLQPAALEDATSDRSIRVDASDWHELDDGQHVHVDLHGVYLSPDFEATFVGGGVSAHRRDGLADERRRRALEQRRRQDLRSRPKRQHAVVREHCRRRARRAGPGDLAQHGRQRRLHVERSAAEAGSRSSTAAATTTARSQIRCDRTRCSSSRRAGTPTGTACRRASARRSLSTTPASVALTERREPAPTCGTWSRATAPAGQRALERE